MNQDEINKLIFEILENLCVLPENYSAKQCRRLTQLYNTLYPKQED